ncbi:SGNH hydrolase-type esterase domain-containing protein [Clohesyomyces aquaticus]|uniref:SGNH hydrolase-type esterase domain-containing protein n=1 Tax=Clohesyomyces aquaticus TaxID=1231657 RepID=A0A1Y1ZBG4_9PLEO|nr:SGNH hydrolase-type esterase domain-containing protein [Clohesyomyces aquaticus]
MFRLILLSCLISGIHSLAIHPRADQLEWTSLGDSYASGVGSTDYVDGGRCLRYNESYPILVNKDISTGDHIFNHAPCSGALHNEIAEWQLLDEKKNSGPNWQYGPRPAFGNPSFATLTAGGDDIDFPGIIFNCIVDVSLWFGGPTRRTCEDQRTYSWGRLQDPALVSNLTSLIQKIVEKGRSRPIGDKFKLYVTGYPKFFSAETRECDNVTFARSANPVDDGKEHPRMTLEVRQEFNNMSDTLNAAIRSAVSNNADKGVTFIDIEKDNFGDDALKGHRYCEPGVKEPDPKNTELYLWHYPYNDAKDDQSDPTVALLENSYNQVVGQLSAQDILNRWPNTVDMQNAMFDAVPENGIQDKATSTTAGWDSIGFRARVFHPQVAYHRFIRDRIFSQYNQDFPPTPCTSQSCCPSGCTCGPSGVPVCG